MSYIAKTLNTKALTDAVLIDETKKLLGFERTTLCSFLVNLAEIDSRKIYASAGYPSLFKYVVKEFNLCEGAAAMRIVVSRHAKIFPRLLDEIQSGRLHLTGAYLLCKNAKRENFDAILNKALHKSKTEIEDILKTEASFSRSIREYVRPVETQVTRAKKQEDKPQEPISLFDKNISTQASPSSSQQPSQDTVLTNETPTAKPQESSDFEIRLGITVKKEVYENLKKLQRLTGKDKLSDVIEKAITHYLDSIDPEKRVARRQSREEKNKILVESRAINKLATFPEKWISTNKECRASRYVPQRIRDEVYTRDQGRCTFVNNKGERCEATHHLELDHLIPFAKGGISEASNLRLKCKAHNLLAARNEFGTEFMKRYETRSS